MSWIEILLLAFSLGLDAFSVGIAVGAISFGYRQIFRLSFHFGLFQFFMLIIGWGVGNYSLKYIGPYNNVVAFIILLLIGIRMITESFGGGNAPENLTDRSKGWSLIFLSFATSIDALGAGFSISLVAERLFVIGITVGIAAALMTLTGMILGKRISKLVGKRSEAFGGFILILIGIKILLNLKI